MFEKLVQLSLYPIPKLSKALEGFNEKHRFNPTPITILLTSEG